MSREYGLMANDNGKTVHDISTLKHAEAKKHLPRLCSEYRRYSEEKAALEAAMKSIKADIDSIAKKARIASTVVGDGWMLSRTTSTRKSLSKEKLLEKGVGMDVIEAATVESRSTFYRVLERKDTPNE